MYRGGPVLPGRWRAVGDRERGQGVVEETIDQGKQSGGMQVMDDFIGIREENEYER